jgi:hypothetical protein
MNLLRATVILKSASKLGSSPLLHHVLKPEVYRDPGANERDMRDRLLWSDTNLPVGVDRTKPLMLSKVLDGHFKGRAKRNHISVVISVEKCGEDAYADAVERLKSAKAAWLAKFAPNSMYVAAAHGDKDHPHLHLVVCNYDPLTRRSLTFSKRQLVHMNSFAWCPPQVGLVPGAGLYARAQDFKQPKTANLRELVKGLAVDPPGKVDALLKSGQASWYQTKSGAWGLQVGPKKFTIAGINYSLRQAGAPYGLAHLPSGSPAACSLKLPKRDTVEQMNRQELAMGVHYGQCTREEYQEYLYDHDVLASTSPEEQAEIHAFLYGPDPELALSESIKDRMERLTNSHLKNRLIYGVREYKGKNHKLVGYMYQKRSAPGPAQRRMASHLGKAFQASLPDKFRKKADAWEQFQYAIGTAFDQLGELVMPDLPPL